MTAVTTKPRDAYLAASPDARRKDFQTGTGIDAPQCGLANDTDRAMLPWARKFNPYDLYSQHPHRPQLAALKPYYEDLLAKRLPSTLRF